MDKEQQAGIILESILAATKRKYDRLQKMLEVTSNRIALNEAEQPEEILELIQARQGYMKEIDMLDLEISQLNGELEKMTGNEEFPGNRQEYPAGIWEKIEEQRKVGLQLIKTMQEMDQCQRPKLEMQFARLRKMRKEMKISRKTMGAYQKWPAQPGSIFVDEKK